MYSYVWPKTQWVSKTCEHKTTLEVSGSLLSVVLCHLWVLKQTFEPTGNESTVCRVTGRKAADCQYWCWVSLHSPPTRQWWWRSRWWSPPSFCAISLKARRRWRQLCCCDLTSATTGGVNQSASLRTPVMLTRRRAQRPSTKQGAKREKKTFPFS